MTRAEARAAVALMPVSELKQRASAFMSTLGALAACACARVCVRVRARVYVRARVRLCVRLCSNLNEVELSAFLGALRPTTLHHEHG